MGCGSSVAKSPVQAQFGGSGFIVPFHPEIVGTGRGDDDSADVLNMRGAAPQQTISPRHEVVCSSCGITEDAIPLESRNGIYLCEGCVSRGYEQSEDEEYTTSSPQGMLEAALAYRPSTTLERYVELLGAQLRLYPAYMPENDQLEIVDIELSSGRLGSNNEELNTVFSSHDNTTNSTKGHSWKSPSDAGSDRGNACQFNRPATPSGVVTSEPSPVSQYLRSTISSFRAKLAYSDEEDAPRTVAPKYILSPVKEGGMALSDDEPNSPRGISSPLSASLAPCRAATELDAIAILRKDRDRDLSVNQGKIFSRVRAWSEMTLIMVFGKLPTEVEGLTSSRSMFSTESPLSPTGRKKPRKLHLSANTLQTLQSAIQKASIEDTPRELENTTITLAGVVAWYYGSAPLKIKYPSFSPTSNQLQLADLHPPCLLEHIYHPVYGYSIDAASDSFKCISTCLSRVTKDFNAKKSDTVVVTAF